MVELASSLDLAPNEGLGLNVHLAFSGVLLSSVFFAGGSLDGVALRALDVGLLPDLTG